MIRLLCVALLGAACMVSTSADAADAKPASLLYRPIKTVADLQSELTAASAAHHPVLVYIRAEWALSALTLEREVLADPQVQAALKGVIQLRFDITDSDDDDKKVVAHFDTIGAPFVAFYGADGKERRNLRAIAFMEAAEFAAVIRQAVSAKPISK